MKKNILFCLTGLFCIISIGLAGNQSAWGSSELLTPIDDFQEVLMPDMFFLGKGNAPLNADWDSIAGGARLESESLIYGKFGNDRIIEKLLIIRTYEIRGASSLMIPDLNFSDKTLLGSGTQTIGSKEFSYTLLTDEGMIDKNELSMIRKKGLVMSDCYLLKAYSGKLMGFLKKSKSHVLYLERIGKGKRGTSCLQAVRADDTLVNNLSASADKCFGKLLGVKERPKSITEKPSGQGLAADKPAEKGDELEKKLSTLKNLLDKGLITQEDYNKKKQQLLEGF